MIKNRKKFLIRIGSILACVLLVAVLVLPCFALDNNSSYREVLQQAVIDYRYSNPAFDAMISILTVQKPASEFNYWLSSLTNLVTGYVDVNSVDDPDLQNAYWIDTGFTKPGGGFSSLYGGLAENVCFSYWYEYDGVSYSNLYQNCWLGLQIDMNTELSNGFYSGYLFVVNADDNSVILRSLIYAKYNNLGSLSGVGIDQLQITSLNTYVFGNTIINPDGDNLALCFATSGNYVSDNQYEYGLLGDDTVTPINPRSLLYGWNYGIYSGGASEEELQDAYNQGYSAGESVAFGEQLLGDSFKTPFEMLQRFTLFEWTDDVGNHHSINLAIVLGAGIGIVLFVWFLKLFAGG